MAWSTASGRSRRLLPHRSSSRCGQPPCWLEGAPPAAGTVEISTEDPTHDLLTLTGWAAGRGADLDALTVTRPSLEDISLSLTNGTEEAA
jgi:hypothetical protein